MNFPGLYRVSAAGGTPTILIPDKAVLGCTTPHFFPDGRHFSFFRRTAAISKVVDPAGGGGIYIGSLDSTLLPGTESGRNPFFSPDGQWMAFFSSTLLKKIPVQGGAGITLGSFSSIAPGASWSKTGDIFVSGGVSDFLWRLSDAGGPRQRLTKMGAGEVSHRWPQVLPGGNVVLFNAPAGIGMKNANIAAVSLKDGPNEDFAARWVLRPLPAPAVIWSICTRVFCSA